MCKHFCSGIWTDYLNTWILFGVRKKTQIPNMNTTIWSNYSNSIQKSNFWSHHTPAHFVGVNWIFTFSPCKPNFCPNSSFSLPNFNLDSLKKNSNTIFWGYNDTYTSSLKNCKKNPTSILTRVTCVEWMCGFNSVGETATESSQTP